MKKERFKVIPTVHLILVKGGKILMLRRANTGFEDGKYSVVAGHLDGNETVVQAMAREAKEEADITIIPENLKVVHVIHRKQSKELERMDFFLTAKKWEGGPKNMEPEKCSDLSWFDLGNLPSNTIPYVRQAIGCVLKGVFYSEHGW